MAMGRQVTTQATAVGLDGCARTTSPNYAGLAGLTLPVTAGQCLFARSVRPDFLAAQSSGLTGQHDISHRLHPVAGERTARAAVPSFETWHQTRPEKRRSGLRYSRRLEALLRVPG